jgi:DNA helicase II / ATP-dependent DNA helicase PcrA
MGNACPQMDFVLHDHQTPRPEFPPIDFRAELNDEQYSAVTARPGPMLVLAGAGSGKTRTLTYRVAWLLHQGVHPRDILLLTFTNKAAKEMLRRVEDLTGVEARRFWGGTFHSIGHRLMRMHGEVVGLEKGFTILDEGEAEALCRDAVDAVDKGFFKDKTHPRAGVLRDMISLARNTCLDIGKTLYRYFPQHEDLTDKVTTFAIAYEKEKRKHNVVDYDDLLVLWGEMLEKAPEIAEAYRRRFQHILVDEYQDTNSLQARVVDAMSGNHAIMAVGDDAQCIYSWRGANFENILTFPDRHPDTTIHRIEINYRSTPEILQLANAVLKSQTQAGRGFEKELRAARGSHEKPFFVPAMDSREQAMFVVTRLRGLLDEGRSLKEVAVLYRAHFQALDLQVELGRAGIDYVITSGMRFFEQAHVKDIVAHLRLVFNPQDLPAFMRLAVLLPKVGEKNARKLYDLGLEQAKCTGRQFIDACLTEMVTSKVPGDAKDDWTALMHSLRDMREAARASSPAEVVRLGIEGWYGLYLKGAYANYIQRLDDLTALVGFAGKYEDLGEIIAQITLLTSETADRSVEDDQNAVRLTTVHQAKGLEFDVVFVIGLAEGQFPLRRAVESGDVEEERRLFYVAVTRARDELYLLHPRISSKGGPIMSQPPSRFVAELAEDLYTPVRLRRTAAW